MNASSINKRSGRHIITILLLMSMMNIASCKNTDVLPDLNLKKLNLEALNLKPLLSGHKDEYISEDNDMPDGFYGDLYREYMALAQYESINQDRKNDAKFFKNRALKAKEQTSLPPLEVTLKKLPEHSRYEISFAREKLVSLLASSDSKKMNALRAFAQTRFDCWLRHSLIFPQQTAYIVCKQQFYTTMRLLDKDALKTLSASIYFDSNSIALNKDAKQQVGKVANTYRNMDPWHIILKGFTDSAGSKTKNKTLSMRRAVAVKNALGQHGFNLNHITILAAGEITQDEAKNESKRNPKSRRVDIYLEPLFQGINAPDDSPQVGNLPGWSHGHKDY